eukprot:1373431-Rhodomonas_salina.1
MVWRLDYTYYNPASGVYAKMCRTSGGQVGETLEVETNLETDAARAARVSLAVLSSNRFAVTWSDCDYTNWFDLSDSGNVFAKIFQAPERMHRAELDGVRLPPLPFLHCELPVTWGDIFGCEKRGVC